MKAFYFTQNSRLPSELSLWNKGMSVKLFFNYGILHIYIKWQKEKNKPKVSVCHSDVKICMHETSLLLFSVTEFTRLPKKAPKESRNFCRAPKVHEANSGYFFSCVSKISQGTTVKNSKFKIMCIICKCPSSRTL